jgi:hypothetical protein
MGVRERDSDADAERVVVVRIAPGSFFVVGALGVLLGALLVGAVFFLRPPAPLPVAQADESFPTAPPATAVPTAAPVAPAAYPPPAAQPTALPPPTFAPIRPTAVLELPTPTETQADFVFVATIAPPNAAPAGNVPASDVPPTLPPAPTAQVRVAARVAAAPDADAPPAAGAVAPAAQSRAPANALRGSTRWTLAQSPVRVERDLLVPAGVTLAIDAGVEVQIARGVAVYVDGALFAIGTADRPVVIRQLDADGRLRFEGIFGRIGSAIAFDHVDISGGGAGGTLLASEAGSLSIRSSRLLANGGHVRTLDARVEVQDTLVAQNDMPYGAAIDITFSRGGTATLLGNRILDNRLASGAAPIAITHQSFSGSSRLEIERNLLLNAEGPNLILVTNAQLLGNLRCNTLIGGTTGLSLRSDAPPTLSPMLNIRDNAFEGHVPPIIPIYLEYGIGRGATSDLPLGMANNWWESPTGPFEPETHADGRGEAVGPNVAFRPWLESRPPCAPGL